MATTEEIGQLAAAKPPRGPGARPSMPLGPFELGVIGLGTMGSNLLLNFADAGFAVAGFDRSEQKARALDQAGRGRPVRGFSQLEDLVRALRRPRALLALVPAGPAVDQVIGAARVLLEPGDLLVDSGNSHPRDTDRRALELQSANLEFVGMGISGGERGARHGACLMPGGPLPAYERLRPLLEAAAAVVDGEPCVAHLGPGSAGHTVKMVHNGIEYGLMQLIAEAYDLLHRGLGLANEDIAERFGRWAEGELGGYLIELTAKVLARRDDRTGGSLVDVILDEAGQKGTGQWTSHDALDLGVPCPTIDAAVLARDLSSQRRERGAIRSALGGGCGSAGRAGLADRVGRALLPAAIATWAQGMALLQAASRARGYALKLDEVARIWRGGCIIRAKLLAPIRAAYGADPELPSLLAAPELARRVREADADLRAAAAAAIEFHVPAPALGASLAYLDSWRSERLPANLIQALRDAFGAHTYRRIDAPGTFHTEWIAEG